MNVQEALDTLKSLGTEQNRKIYRRHGAAEDVYGVSYAHLKDLKKKIKTDHGLAEGLWAAGNHDGRILGTLVADPKRMDGAALDRWAGALRSRTETDAFASVAAAAQHIGKVEVDHGETGCKTPDAVPYIKKALERKKA